MDGGRRDIPTVGPRRTCGHNQPGTGVDFYNPWKSGSPAALGGNYIANDIGWISDWIALGCSGSCSFIQHYIWREFYIVRAGCMSAFSYPGPGFRGSAISSALREYCSGRNCQPDWAPVSLPGGNAARRRYRNLRTGFREPISHISRWTKGLEIILNTN